jgi:hypothetical protein
MFKVWETLLYNNSLTYNVFISGYYIRRERQKGKVNFTYLKSDVGSTEKDDWIKTFLYLHLLSFTVFRIAITSESSWQLSFYLKITIKWEFLECL